MRAIREDQRDLQKQHDDLVDRLPGTYARRDDVKAAMDDVKGSMREVNAKLDRLLERRYGDARPDNGG